MNRFLMRIAALALVPALVLPDPVSAIGMAAFAHSEYPLSAESFTFQALQPYLEAGYRRPENDPDAVFICKTAKIVLVAGAWLALSPFTLIPGFGQAQPPKAGNPPYGSIAEVMKENKQIAKADYRNLWNQKVRIPLHVDQLEDFIDPVEDNSIEAAEEFTKTQQQSELWFKAASGNVISGQSTDAHLAPRIGFNGPKIGDSFLYERRRDLNPQTQLTSATMAESDSWIVKTLKGIRDVFLNGGIEFHSKLALAKSRLEITIQEIGIRVRYAGVETVNQAAVKAFQRDLYKLMAQDFRLQAKQQEIRFKEKQRAQWSDNPDDWPIGAPQKIQQMKQELAALRLELNTLQGARAEIDDRLRNRLIWTAEEITSQPSLHPRPPQITLSKTLIETLANLRLPGEAEGSPVYRLPPAERLQNRLAAHLDMLAKAGLIPAGSGAIAKQLDPYSPAFAALLLDRGWVVKPFHQPILVNEPETNPRRLISADALDRLLDVPTENPSYIAQTPTERGYLFQAEVIRAENSRLAKDLETDSSGAIRLRWAAGLPITAEYERRKVLDPSSVEHGMTALEIAEKIPPLLGQEYRRGTLLPEAQELRTARITEEGNAREKARLLIDSFQALDNALKPPAASNRHRLAEETLPASTDFVTPSKAILLEAIDLKAGITALQATEDAKFLLTKEGQASLDDATAKHMAQGLAGADLLFVNRPAAPTTPVPPPAPATPGVTPKDAKPSPPAPRWPLFHRPKKEPKKQGALLAPGKSARRVLAIMALGPSLGFSTPLWKSLHVGALNPGTGPLFLWLLMPVGLALYFLTSAVIRNGAVSKNRWFALGFPAAAGLLMFMGFPAIWAAAAPFAAFALAATTALTLPQRVFDLSKHSLPSLSIHFWNSGPRKAFRVNGIGKVLILAGLIHAFWQPLSNAVDWIKLGLNPTMQQAHYIGSEVEQGPVFTGAPKNQSGKIENNPISQGTAELGGQYPYGMAWASKRDPEFTSRIQLINQRLAELNIQAHISGIEQLDTENPAGRYKRAFVQVMSDNGPGSIEERLDATLTLEETALLEGGRTKNQAEQNRDYSGSAGTSRREKMDEIALARLAEALSAVLGEREWRDQKVTQPTKLLPDTKQLIKGTPVTSTSSILLGMQVRRDIAKFLFILMPQEAAAFETFQRDPKAIAVFEDLDTGTPYYFHPTNIRDVLEPKDDKGLFGTLQHNTAIGPLPEFRIRVPVALPDAQLLPPQAKAYKFLDFYSAKALGTKGTLGAKGKLDLRDEYRLKVEPLSRGQIMGVAEIMPSDPVPPRLEGPADSLRAQARAYAGARDHYRSLMAGAKQAYLRYRGTGVDDMANEQRAVFEESQDKTLALEKLIRSVDDEKKEWESAGVPADWNMAKSNAANAAVKVYPAHPEAAALYPLALKSFVPFSKEDAAWDHQTLYGLGQKARIHVKADARQVKDLALQTGEHMQMSVAGSTYKVDCMLTHVELREREFPVPYFELEVSVDVKHLDQIYPLLRYGLSPVGAVIVTLERTTAAVNQNAPADVSPTAAKRPRTPHATSKLSDGLYKPLFLTGLTAAGLTPFFPLAAHWILGMLLAGGLGLLLSNLISRNPFLRLGSRFVGTVELPARPSKPANEAFLLGVNGGSYLTGSEFLEVIGPGTIHSESIVNGEANETLHQWQLPERALAWKMISAEINEVKNIQVLLGMADHLGVTPSQVYAANRGAYFSDSLWNAVREPSSDVAHRDVQKIDAADLEEFKAALRSAVKTNFEKRFEALTVWTLETRRGDPLGAPMGAVVPLTTKRIAFMDRDFLQWMISRHSESNATLKDKRTAQKALFITFFHFAAAPDLLENAQTPDQNVGVYALDSNAQKQYEKDLDFVRAKTDPSSNVDRVVQTIRRRRAERYPEVRSKISSAVAPLTPQGLRALDEKIRNKPRRREVEDSKGRRLSGRQALYDRLQFWGVTEKTARLLEWDYVVQNKLKPLANSRTTFVLLIDLLLLASIGLFVRYPGLLGYIGFVVTRADTTRTLLGMSPTDALPQWVLNLFLYTLVGAFFLGAYKAVSEWVAGNLFDVPATFLWMTGGIRKRKAEVFQMTGIDSDLFLKRNYEEKPLHDDGELSEPLLQFAAMYNNRLYKVLLDKNSQLDISVKREIVDCLYQYAENPLHRREEFFRPAKDLQLPSDEDVARALPPGLHLRPKEIAVLFEDENNPYLEALRKDLRRPRLSAASLDRLSPAQNVAVKESLERSGFPLLEDWLRDRMDEKRISLAAGAIATLESPVPALALISRDLAGWAFYMSAEERAKNKEEIEEMEKVLRDLVERLSTLAPEIYVRYREYSRYHNQWEAISLIIGAIREANPQLAPDIYDHFKSVLSEIDVDPTNPLVLRTLSGFQKYASFAVKLLLAPVTLVSPGISLWIKKSLRIIRRRLDPSEQMALALLLKNTNVPVREGDILAFDEILRFRLFGVKDSSGRIDEAKLQEYYDSREFKPLRRLAEANGLEVLGFLRSYLLNQGTDAAGAVLGRFFDETDLGSGNRNNLAFQFFRREDKSSAETAEAFHERLLGGKRIGDPARPPVYMETQFLQDEHMKPTTAAASLEQADSRAASLLDEINRLTPAGVPAPFGSLELVQEGALAMTRQRTLVDFLRDSQSLAGDINLVSVSRGLLPFMMEVFNRIRERLPPRVARRVWPLFFHQIRGELRRGSNHRRLILTSPENHSLDKWLDPRFVGADVIIVPNPYLTSAAKLLAFIFLMPEEKADYFAAVRRAHGEAKAAALEKKLEDYVHLLRSFHLEIAQYPERYVRDVKTGTLVDKLENKMPPFSYRTFVLLPAGALRKLEALDGEQRALAPRTSPFQWLTRHLHWPRFGGDRRRRLGRLLREYA